MIKDFSEVAWRFLVDGLMGSMNNTVSYCVGSPYWCAFCLGSFSHPGSQFFNLLGHCHIGSYKSHWDDNAAAPDGIHVSTLYTYCSTCCSAVFVLMLLFKVFHTSSQVINQYSDKISLKRNSAIWQSNNRHSLTQGNRHAVSLLQVSKRHGMHMECRKHSRNKKL